MSYGQSTQSINHGSRQGNSIPRPAQYQSSSNAAQAYPYNYPRRAEAANFQNAATTSQNQHDVRHANANTGISTSTAVRNGDDTAQSREVIHPNMQIPAAVNDSGGSLGELAAQMTCFFWFETIETIRKAENWTAHASPVRRLGPDSVPTISFRKWVITILTTTQVAQNVISLALLFIYRLKTSNPTVKGKSGSEYRLLTVALMLGNKFLDDNTYTNKTWAEVSGISVGEIHVMEVEFLSNMRYSLFASKEQWDLWQTQLGDFSKYFHRALKAPLTPSPVRSGFLPPPSAPPMPVYSPNTIKTEQNHQAYTGLYGSTLQALPYRSADLAKKRSYEDIIGMEPAPKRPSTMASRQVPPTLHGTLPLRNIPRLPVPNLSVSTNSNMNYAGFPQSLPPLPPMSGRAMAQVYPSTPNWTPSQPSMHQQQSAMSLPPIGAPALGYSGALTPGMTPNFGSGGAIYSLPSSHQGTPSRRHSPRIMSLHSGVHSMNSSPITGSFANQDVYNNSPSIYLQQRDSPYKPLRPPNKLLYPPPGSYQDYSQHHQPTIDQMHYQPLGRRNDYRTGVVPEYRGGPEPAAYWQQPFRPMGSPQYSSGANELTRSLGVKRKRSPAP